jgi:hypothetical protein
MSTEAIALRDLEDFYDALAQTIDHVGEAQTPLFLTKLALHLASEVRDPARLQDALAVALRDLQPAP